MIRDVDIRDISDGRFYRANDMVRADTGGCSGCSRCCYGMKDTILADPLDVMRLEKVTGKTFDMLLDGFLNLRMADGLILPCLAMTGEAADGTPLPEEEQHCVFLNTESGRCSVHAARTGFCRLYPLGRQYHDGGFSYFVLPASCPGKTRSKARISAYLGVPDLPMYEEYLLSWHDFLARLREKLERTEAAGFKDVCMAVLRLFYFLPYEPERDFYLQYRRRLKKAERLLLS